jgi:hypothetical protein
VESWVAYPQGYMGCSQGGLQDVHGVATSLCLHLACLPHWSEAVHAVLVWCVHVQGAHCS